MAHRKSFDEERVPLIEQSNAANEEEFEEAGCKEKAAFAIGVPITLGTCGAMLGAGVALVACRGLIRSEVIDVDDAEATCKDIYAYGMLAGAILGAGMYLYGLYRTYKGDWKLAKTSTTFIHEVFGSVPSAPNNDVVNQIKVESNEDTTIEVQSVLESQVLANQEKTVGNPGLPFDAINRSATVEVEVNPINKLPEVEVQEQRAEKQEAPKPWYRRCC